MASEEEIIKNFGRTYAPGQYIFKEGDPGDEMFIIHSGAVKITKKTDEGEKTLVVLTSGDFFGEMAVIDHEPRSASAIAEKETVCIALNEELFEQQMQRNAKIVKKILKNMSARLRAMNEQLRNLTTKDYNMRVVNTLLMLVSKSGDNSRISLEELTSQAAMEENRQKLEEILKAMEKAKVISIADNIITVSSADNIGKYKQYLEMKKAFGEI